MKGNLIVVDGIEGGGKSSCIKIIKRVLEEHGIKVITTREPGGTPMGEDIRDLFKAQRYEPIHENTELLLMFASRSQLVENIIKPSLDKGLWVISDRFTSSTVAYQSAGRGVGIEKVKILEGMILGDLKPEMTFIMDLPPEIGMARAKSRGELDRIEQEEMDFFHRVRKGYLDQANESPEKFTVINAEADQEAVFKEIKEKLLLFLNEKNILKPEKRSLNEPSF